MAHTPPPLLSDKLVAAGISLRPRRPDDSDFVRDVYVAYRWDEMQLTGWAPEACIRFLHDQNNMQSAHYDKHYPGAAWCIIEVDGRPAGRLYIQQDISGDMRIIDIALMPAYRNCGIGGGLVAAVQDHACAQGAAKVSIHVEQSNPARKLYERLGFQPVADKPPYCLLEWPAA